MGKKSRLNTNKKPVASPKKERNWFAIGLTGVILAFFVSMTLLVVHMNNAPLDTYTETPLNIEKEDDNSVLLSANDSAPVLDIYEDPKCPYCKMFETEQGDDVIEKAEDGEIQIRYHQLNILDGESPSGRYSSKIGLVYSAIADRGNAGDYLNFHAWVYKNQPTGNTELTDDDITEGLARVQIEDLNMDFEDTERGGEFVKAATEDWNHLQQVMGESAGVPAIINNETPINVNGDKNWLDNVK